jgi:hypothetical protein
MSINFQARIKALADPIRADGIAARQLQVLR